MYSLPLSVAMPSTVVSFEYMTTQSFIRSHFSHVLFFLLLWFMNRCSLLRFVVGWPFFILLHPSLAVFYQASAFNQDVSKWNTSAVLDMTGSKCTLSPSLWPRLPLWCILNIRHTTTRVLSDHTSHICGGLVFPFRCCTLSCSVCWRICVQSGRVQMEYGGGDNYERK